MRLGRLVDELVERERHEVHEHDLDDWANAGLRGSDRNAADRGLADRRVADTLGAELLREPGGRTPRPTLRYVLSEDQHPGVGPHRLCERARDRPQIRRLAHVA